VYCLLIFFKLTRYPSLGHDARYKCKPLPEQVYERLAKPRLIAVKRQIDHAISLAAKAKA